MKTNSLILMSLVTGGALFATLAPAAMKDKLYGVATFATDERRCFNFHKDSFNDPDSAYVEKSHISEIENRHLAFLSKEYKEMLHVKVRVKNQLGAYDWDYVSCPLIDGKFDKHATSSYEYVLDYYQENHRRPPEEYNKSLSESSELPVATPAIPITLP